MQKVIDFQQLPLDSLHESPSNPRKRFDEQALNDLVGSISTSGILTPLIVRPNAKGYEIGAGHRRYRAAKKAGLTEVPCIVRPMADEQFLELLIIENDQREDVHPLEEAEGYHALSRRPGYDVAKIAERIGRSEKYVYDRLKLLSLTKKAQELFLANKFSAGHAILLARLSPSDQERAINPSTGGLFQREDMAYMFRDLDEDGEPLKAKSTRELQAWIDEHVKFDREKIDPMLFPETANQLAVAEEKSLKIVQITETHYVQPEARGKEKIIGPRSWKRADGLFKSKKCEHSVVGVFAVGPGRGSSMLVCIAKESCKIHWAEWQKEREERASNKIPEISDKQKAKQAAAEQKRVEQEKLEREKRERLLNAMPKIFKAFGEALKKTQIKTNGYWADVIVEAVQGWKDPDEKSLLPRGKTADDLLRHLAHLVVMQTHGAEEISEMAKTLGIDLDRIVNVDSESEKTMENKKSKSKKK